MTLYVPSTPNMLGRSALEFSQLLEQDASYVNPAYIPQEEETLPQRQHAGLWLYQMAVNEEVQAFMIAATDQGSQASVATTDATPTNIVQISVADGECVEINASIDGKQTAGGVSHAFQRLWIKAVRVDAGAGLEVVQTVDDTGPSYDSNGLSTVSYRIVPNAGNNSLDIEATGEAATNITHTVIYTLRRF
ncbi:MAG: hypothetical protein GY926_19625 [bacterium]|nr:hypothetical protein [bacterium]